MKPTAAFTSLILLAGAAHAAGDAKQGEVIFGRCAMCHTIAKGAGNGMGPNLFGVASKKAASVQGFSYSPALKGANITWTDDKLKAWFANPQKLVPGTRMYFSGIKKPQEADDLIAYMKSKK
ncbi:cytochrome c [Rhizomicrobium palustre]|uniref:Cytochrome c n=1 Tax=Rhizomicrobium palustre TaxID=189966 RepID=A0A846MXG2_9PROT|nr:cytochrome c family protein [Rhizomicrobium palustre]NIK87915.1 cytochrome c [Rhizomicrobium palustre]